METTNSVFMEETTIITGFNTIQDVEDTLKWIEANTDYKWESWSKPTEFQEWKYNFNRYQGQWGFSIKYEENLTFCNLDFYENAYSNIKKIKFKYLPYLLEESFKEGERVYVSDTSIEEALESKKERIYLCTVQWNTKYKYICVDNVSEKDYKDWKYFATTFWKHIVKIHKPSQVQEMTMEEICKELGREIKIKK